MAEHDGDRTVTIHHAPDSANATRFVEIVSPGDPPVVRLRRGLIRIGRDESNQVVIKDSSISRSHVEVRVGPEGVEVVDLDTKNGTYFQGARIRTLPVRTEATLVLGRQSVVRVRVLDEAQPAIDEGAELIGASGAMVSLRRAIEKVAATPLTVLIEGETGTGKEVVARAIHARSNRARGRFVVVDCGAVSPTLAATELFGHTKGAYTGASGATEGAFRRARGGTLFIDEIGELPLELQPALLRALEAREVKPVGGDAYVPVDVRIVAATNRDLEAEVAAGRFRKDLLFRLAVARIKVAPLDARPGDVPMLASHFANALGGARLSPEVLSALAARRWPGNVRELRNAVERLVMLAGGPGSTVATLEDDDESGESSATPVAGAAAGGFAVPVSLPPGMSYQEFKQSAVDALERDYLARLYVESDCNLAEAARRAGMNRRYLDELFKKHKIDRVQLKAQAEAAKKG